MVNIYLWISLNALLMKVIEISGHLVTIFFCIPLIVYLVRALREKRIDYLLNCNIDKIRTDIDALI